MIKCSPCSASSPNVHMVDAHIFLAVLVDSEVDGAERAAANLLLDEVLVDAVLCGAVVLGIAVLGARIERFLWCSRQRGVSLLAWWTCLRVWHARTFTLRVDEAARLWCRSGEWYAGRELEPGVSMRSFSGAMAQHGTAGRAGRRAAGGGAWQGAIAYVNFTGEGLASAATAGTSSETCSEVKTPGMSDSWERVSLGGRCIVWARRRSSAEGSSKGRYSRGEGPAAGRGAD